MERGQRCSGRGMSASIIGACHDRVNVTEHQDAQRAGGQVAYRQAGCHLPRVGAVGMVAVTRRDCHPRSPAHAHAATSPETDRSSLSMSTARAGQVPCSSSNAAMSMSVAARARRVGTLRPGWTPRTDRARCSSHSLRMVSVWSGAWRWSGVVGRRVVRAMGDSSSSRADTPMIRTVTCTYSL